MGPFVINDTISFESMTNTSIITILLKSGKVGILSSIISSRHSLISTLPLTSVDKPVSSEIKYVLDVNVLVLTKRMLKSAQPLTKQLKHLYYESVVKFQYDCKEIDS